MSQDPQSIGRYSVQRVLGRGAMGVVYLAMDPLLKRPVAIKTLRDAGEEDVAITMERFHREAEISARLSHPNIITVFDVGSDPKAGPFLAMEYIDGASLSTLIRQHLNPDTGMRLLLQGMSALMAAEQGGIVHRDVKPDNMLVGQDGRLKLMDFGIARGNESRLTQAGMVFGTPSYTAPELLLGGEPTPVTDRYAFAVTAFELFGLALPFHGSNVASTLYKVVHEQPKIPEHMGEGVAEVFRQALAKDPAQRFPDLPSFMLALTVALPLTDEQRAKLLGMLDGDHPLGGSRPFPLVRTEQLPELETPTVATGPRVNPRPQAEYLAPQARLEPSDELPLMVPEEPSPAAVVPPASRRGPWKALVAAGVALLLAGGGWVAWKRLAKPPTHALTIRTDPAGAEVLLNGKSLGHTPLGPFQIRDDEAKGMVRFQLEGYEPLQVDLAQDDKVLDYPLQRLPYEVTLVTDPEGAEVLLNGEASGKTPMKLKVPSNGPQVLLLKREGYQEWKATLERDVPFPALVTLSPLAFKTAVLSEPKGAEVLVDGRSVGKTPLKALEVPSEGRHEVRLRLEGYADWSGRIEKSKPLPNPVVLKAKTFPVEVRTEPAGATLWLDGQKVGATPQRAELTVLGTHAVRLTLEGHQEFTGTVSPEHPLPPLITLAALKKAEPPKPKAEEKKPGFWKRVFGTKKGEEKKN